MKLSEFMSEAKLDDAGMAALINQDLEDKDKVSEKAVQNWRYGIRTPRPRIMARIAVVSEGKTTALDFMPSTAGEAA